MFSYDLPLPDAVLYTGDTSFTTAATKIAPCGASAELAVSPGTPGVRVRYLGECRVIGAIGVVKTAGTAVINIGDGTTVDRYGTITFDSTVTAGNSAKATILLTEEGCHMGTAMMGKTAPSTFVLTSVAGGTAVITDLKIALGHW